MDNEEKGFCKGNGEPWKILEFYSGIGGMRYSVLRAGIQAIILEAFDINDIANDVYKHNFGHRPCQRNIQNLTAAELDKYGADAWLLSPPCQPYTRQGLQKDLEDARASSFLKILELIPHTLQPPFMLFVENVVGFETSKTHHQMMDILVKTGFVTQEYMLSPLQFGVPYSRPRYFCLAQRKSLAFQEPCFHKKLFFTLTPAADENAPWPDNCNNLKEKWQRLGLHCQPIKNFLETTISSSSNYSETSEGGPDSRCLEQYLVPLNLIERWGTAMDIVHPDSKCCCCFTKSYYRYVKGTGSLLATTQNGDSWPEKADITTLKKLDLRYFTPREVANLHSFPVDFNFPQHISLKQQYALLGNSLSVAVVAPLLRHLFTVSL